jgi:hypothetical protein
VSPLLLATVEFIAALLWVPVLIKFWRAWRARRNPISLAIAGLAAFAAWTCALPHWVFSVEVDRTWLGWGVTVLNLAVASNFYVAIHRAKGKFPEARGE